MPRELDCCGATLAQEDSELVNRTEVYCDVNHNPIGECMSAMKQLAMDLENRLEHSADVLQYAVSQLKYCKKDVAECEGASKTMATFLVAFALPACRAVMVPGYVDILEEMLCRLVWPKEFDNCNPRHAIRLIRRRCRRKARKNLHVGGE